jgi:hypothetical protein
MVRDVIEKAEDECTCTGLYGVAAQGQCYLNSPSAPQTADRKTHAIATETVTHLGVI